MGIETNVAVFIVESLGLEDERERLHQEGRVLKSMLRLSNVPSKYWYIRTELELKAVLQEFSKSSMRYLHLSCHANDSLLQLTLEGVRFARFGELIRPHLDGRRLFLSACEAANDDLAQYVIPNSGCNSVIGPTDKIRFDDAAIFWASFYHLVFRENRDAMQKRDIKAVLPKACEMFSVRMRYFSKSDKAPYYREENF